MAKGAAMATHAPFSPNAFNPVGPGTCWPALSVRSDTSTAPNTISLTVQTRKPQTITKPAPLPKGISAWRSGRWK
jgi:hypothetical protein